MLSLYTRTIVSLFNCYILVRTDFGLFEQLDIQIFIQLNCYPLNYKIPSSLYIVDLYWILSEILLSCLIYLSTCLLSRVSFGIWLVFGFYQMKATRWSSETLAIVCWAEPLGNDNHICKFSSNCFIFHLSFPLYSLLSILLLFLSCFSFPLFFLFSSFHLYFLFFQIFSPHPCVSPFFRFSLFFFLSIGFFFPVIMTFTPPLSWRWANGNNVHPTILLLKSLL